jgi:hypothetical protein
MAFRNPTIPREAGPSLLSLGAGRYVGNTPATLYTAAEIDLGDWAAIQIQMTAIGDSVTVFLLWTGMSGNTIVRCAGVPSGAANVILPVLGPQLIVTAASDTATGATVRMEIVPRRTLAPPGALQQGPTTLAVSLAVGAAATSTTPALFTTNGPATFMVTPGYGSGADTATWRASLYADAGPGGGGQIILASVRPGVPTINVELPPLPLGAAFTNQTGLAGTWYATITPRW